MKQQTSQSSYEETFITYDLALTCALLTQGHLMRGMDSNDNVKTGFEFTDDDILRNDIKRYWNDQLRVNPRTYFNMLKDLKSRIYTRKKY
jgi:hypothetical protein